MKKKFLPSYSPARLIQSSTRFYISLYALSKKGELRRFRPTFNLNRIHNLPERVKRGLALEVKINWWLEQGNYFEDFNEMRVTQLMILHQKELEMQSINICEAINKAVNWKISETTRRNSKKALASHRDIFLKFLKKKKYDSLNISDFGPKQAFEYIEYLVNDLKIHNNNTFNNKLTYIKSFFNWLADKSFIEKNPFAKIKRRRKTKATIRVMTKEEMVIIANECKKRYPFLWLATQFAFWGLVRQEEMTRLKIGFIKLKPSLFIDMPADATKNWKPDPITLPSFIFEYLNELKVFDHPSDFYLFGNGMEPSRKVLPESSFHKRHSSALKWLHKKKILDDIENLSFRSWRKTGMNYFSNILPPRKFKDHNRHDNFQTTEHYLNQREVIGEVAALKNDIF